MAKKKAWDTPAYRSLVASVAKSIASSGSGVSSSTGAPWGHFASDPNSTVDNAQKIADEILGKRGLKRSDLDAETQKALRNADRADAQSIALGAERKKKRSWWMKGLDFISRPMYASANAADEGMTKFATSGGDISDTLGATLHGARRGITAREKRTFSDVIQHAADMHAYGEAGGTDPLKAKQGQAKVNPWLKYGVGFAADVALDPTTYLGVGLLTKGAHGKEAIKAIEGTAKATETVGKGTKLTPAQVHEVTAAHLAPVENLSKRKIAKLTPQAQEIAKVAQDFQKEIGRKGVRNLRKDKGAGTAYLGTKVTGTDKTVRDILSALETGSKGVKVAPKVEAASRDTVNSYIKKDYPGKFDDLIDKLHDPHATEALPSHLHDLEKEYYKVFKATEANINKATAYKASLEPVKKVGKVAPVPGLTTDVLKNISPDVTKQLALRFGKAVVPIPGVATGVGKTASALRSVKPVDAGVKKFEELFRAKAGISPALHGMRNEAAGGLGQRVVHYAKNLRSIYDQVPEAARKGVMQAYRKGAHEGNSVTGGLDLISGQPVRILDHFKGEVERMSRTVDDLGILPEEFNQFVSKAYEAPKLKSKGVNKYGERQYSDAERVGWLKEHVRTSAEFTDPGKALHHLNAAIEQIASKRAMEGAIGNQFGVKMASAPTKKGDRLIHTEQTRALKAQGWRQVKGSKELRGTLFHPDVAHGIEKMTEVFGSRQSVDGFLGAVEKSTSAVKSLMTIYNPGFHPRTFMGEILLNYMSGMPIHQIANYYKKAAQVMMGRDRELLGDAAGALGKSEKQLMEEALAKEAGMTVPKSAELSRSQIRTANIIHGGQSTTAEAFRSTAGHKPVMRMRNGEMLTADQVWHAYLNSGVKSGFASVDLVRSNADKAMFGKHARKANEGVKATSEFVEDTGRMAQFMFELSRSRARNFTEASKEAAERVMKYHLDYSAVTRTEQKISQYAIPFYKWLRLSTPLMIDVLIHNPGKVLQVPKALSSISKALGYDEGPGQGLFPASPDVMTPEFLRNHGAYPMFGGNTHYFDPTSLFPVAGSTDLLDFTGNPGDSNTEKARKALWDRMNPLITKPTGLGKYDKQKELDWLLATTPQTNLGKNLVAPPDPDINNWERLMMFLGNPGFVSNTEKKVRGEVYKERDASYINRKARKKELGIK